MLTTNLIRKVSEIHGELEGAYQELQADKKTSGQFRIGETARFLRLAMLATQNLERKVA